MEDFFAIFDSAVFFPEPDPDSLEMLDPDSLECWIRIRISGFNGYGSTTLPETACNKVQALMSKQRFFSESGKVDLPIKKIRKTKP